MLNEKVTCKHVVGHLSFSSCSSAKQGLDKLNKLDELDELDELDKLDASVCPEMLPSRDNEPSNSCRKLSCS